MCTHLNFTSKSMHVKWVTTTYAFIKIYKEVDEKENGCTELVNCVLIGVCAVIRSNRVHTKLTKYICILYNLHHVM